MNKTSEAWEQLWVRIKENAQDMGKVKMFIKNKDTELIANENGFVVKCKAAQFQNAPRTYTNSL